MDEIQFKVCTKCKKVKEYSEYHKNKNKKNGLHCWCKQCANDYRIAHLDQANINAAKSRAKHKGERNEYHRKYQADNKERLRAYRKAYYHQYYIDKRLGLR